jgi:hypothetical protein
MSCRPLAEEGDGMKIPVGRLVFGMAAVCVLSCRGVTSMLGSDRCSYMPTVEDCQSAAASLITDQCLRDCVIGQCRRGQVVCGAEVVARCSEIAVETAPYPPAGYVTPESQTCEMPKNYIAWCQLEQSPRCQELTMVHERAYACGWHHKGGKGVPGDDGKIIGCQPPDH